MDYGSSNGFPIVGFLFLDISVRQVWPPSQLRILSRNFSYQRLFWVVQFLVVFPQQVKIALYMPDGLYLLQILSF